MGTLTVTANGRITFDKDTLEHLGIEGGDRIVVEKLPGGRIEVRAARSGSISDVFGLLKNKTTRTLTIEQMNAIAGTGLRGKK